MLAITALAVALAIGTRLAGFGWSGIAVLALGAAASFVLASRLGDNPFWHAAGPFYIGLPALAIVALRSQPALGLQTVLGVFLIVWATDTGAFFFGKLIGGPKMVPHLSPGKTWAGTIGGSVTAAIVYGLYIGILGFNMLEAMGFALLFSVAAPLAAASLPPFSPTDETTERGVVLGPDGLDALFAFPLHVEAIRRFFAARGVVGPGDYTPL